jgi:hypothetical protein
VPDVTMDVEPARDRNRLDAHLRARCGSGSPRSRT